MLRRIELRDHSGDFRGLFRAMPSRPVDHILQPLVRLHKAPWENIDLTRQPRFFFTQRAWDEFAESTYHNLLFHLGMGNVRLIVVSEDDVDAVPVDEVQSVVYDQHSDGAEWSVVYHDGEAC